MLRPGYHISPAYGWMNDPNGMMQYQGRVHVFFQYNPYAPYWASPSWGHVVSEDLVLWRWLPIALHPDHPYDSSGVFSGSATVLKDKGPVLLYTAVSGAERLDYYHQTQAVAIPADLSDADLVVWNKIDNNPVGVEVPPGGDNAQFRDPTTAWLAPSPRDPDQLVWYTAIGVQTYCVGGAALYLAEDITGRWTYNGRLCSQVDVDPEGVGECNLSGKNQSQVIHAPGGEQGKCDEHGTCRMWECPDYFDISDHVHVMKYSDQTKLRVQWAADWYVLSDEAVDVTNALTRNDGKGAFAGQFNQLPYAPRLIDYGDVYASKTFLLDDGRRVWLGWVYESSLGCEGVCGTGTDYIKEHQGWQGMQSLLREVTYDSETDELLFYPVKEVEKLRGDMLFQDTFSTSQGVESLLPLYNDSTIPDTTRQVEIHLQVTPQLATEELSSEWIMAGSLFKFSSGVVLYVGESSKTYVYMNGTLQAGEGGGRFLLVDLGLYVDKGATGGMTQPVEQGGPVAIPRDMVVSQGGDLNLTVFIDHSVLEVFAMRGRGRVTSRIYPDSAAAVWDIGTFGQVEGLNSGVELKMEVMVWPLGTCWVPNAGPDDMEVGPGDGMSQEDRNVHVDDLRVDNLAPILQQPDEVHHPAGANDPARHRDGVQASKGQASEPRHQGSQWKAIVGGVMGGLVLCGALACMGYSSWRLHWGRQHQWTRLATDEV